MRVYDIDVEVYTSDYYRVEANSLEGAKAAARREFLEQLYSGSDIKVEGEESDDQESETDLYTKG